MTSKLAAFIARLPPGLRPTLGAVNAVEEAFQLMQGSTRFAANLRRHAQRQGMAGIGRARGMVGMGDLSADAGGDVSAVTGLVSAANSGDTGAILGAGIKAVGAGVQTAVDISKATGGGGAGASAGGVVTPAGLLAWINANTQNGHFTGPAVKWRNKTYTGDQVLKLVPELQNATRAGQAATAYISVNKGPWQPWAGKWAADGIHFVPNVAFPANTTHVLVTQSGLPPSVDPNATSLRPRTTPTGQSVAGPATATSASLPLAIAAGGALLIARNFL